MYTLEPDVAVTWIRIRKWFPGTQNAASHHCQRRYIPLVTTAKSSMDLQ